MVNTILTVMAKTGHPLRRQAHVTQFDHFGVQKCVVSGGEIVVDACRHVDALSPLHAAELALGESLSLQGNVADTRAKVWRLGEDYLPHSVLLHGVRA